MNGFPLPFNRHSTAISFMCLPKFIIHSRKQMVGRTVGDFSQVALSSCFAQLHSLVAVVIAVVVCLSSSLALFNFHDELNSGNNTECDTGKQCSRHHHHLWKLSSTHTHPRGALYRSLLAVFGHESNKVELKNSQHIQTDNAYFIIFEDVSQLNVLENRNAVSPVDLVGFVCLCVFLWRNGPSLSWAPSSQQVPLRAVRSPDR